MYNNRRHTKTDMGIQSVKCQIYHISPHLDQHSHSVSRLDWHLVQVRTSASRYTSRLARHSQLLVKLFIFAMPGCISHNSWITHSLPMVNNYSCAPKYRTIQHTQLFPPPILLHSFLWLLRRPTIEHKFTWASTVSYIVSPSLDLLGCLRRYSVHILQEQEEVTRDWNDCRSLRKWQMA